MNFCQFQCNFGIDSKDWYQLHSEIIIVYVVIINLIHRFRFFWKVIDPKWLCVLTTVKYDILYARLNESRSWKFDWYILWFDIFSDNHCLINASYNLCCISIKLLSYLSNCMLFTMERICVYFFSLQYIEKINIICVLVKAMKECTLYGYEDKLMSSLYVT